MSLASADLLLTPDGEVFAARIEELLLDGTLTACGYRQSGLEAFFPQPVPAEAWANLVLVWSRGCAVPLWSPRSDPPPAWSGLKISGATLPAAEPPPSDDRSLNVTFADAGAMAQAGASGG